MEQKTKNLFLEKKEAMNKSITIVSALINLQRDKLSEPFGRSFQLYLEHFENFLKVPHALVLFIEESLVEFVWQHRDKSNTKITIIAIEDLVAFEHYDKIQQIRQDRIWHEQSDWLKDSPQAQLENYNPLVMKKLGFLNAVAKENPFNSQHICWLDAGISQTVHPGYFTHDLILNKWSQLSHSFNFICFPYINSNEIHGFDTEALTDYAQTDEVKYVARGGFFGGPVNSISRVYDQYHKTLNDTLSSGYMGTEESIFTILTYLDSSLQLAFIKSDGLLSDFFENLKDLEWASEFPDETLKDIDVAEDDLSEWHDSSDIHFQNAIHQILTSVDSQKEMQFLNIGASTGRFSIELKKHLPHLNTIEIEPFLPAHNYAKKLAIENTQCYHGILSKEPAPLYLNYIDNHENNFGVFTISNGKQSNTLPCPSLKFEDIINQFSEGKIDIIRIHTGNFSLEQLDCIYTVLHKNKTFPLIVFDYGYYESRDRLAQSIQKYIDLGYSSSNPYEFGGGDIVLTYTQSNKKSEEQAAKTRINKFPENSGRFVATYVITYNKPLQLEMLLQSFEQSGKYLLYNTQKYLINNSDDKSVAEHYSNLAKTYGFIELKNGNLGISGGRQFAADHFNATNCNYMYYFEDDMLLAVPGQEACSNGLIRFIPDLFEKLCKIMDQKKLDFIKLSFTEFFGDNNSQWAWYNLPEDVRKEIYPSNYIITDKSVPPRTNFEPIEFIEGIPILTGEVFYCNWPHIISKQANKKMFLETRWTFPNEATWMSHFFQMLKNGELEAAVILASPIDHQRDHHYEAETRKEYNSKIDFSNNSLNAEAVQD